MVMNLSVARSQNDLREHIAGWRRKGLRIGFVPTMGALHDGHLSLVRLAKKHADRVVGSIYVNPTQFAPGEDFEAYPRNEATDLANLATAGADLAYLPTDAEMYPSGSLTDVRVEQMSDLLDGGPRPHFFYGVTTIVARLFLHVAPDVAVFGEKDFQQLQIIRRMTRDLGFPIDIIGGPTFRDADGLAQSSRNAYLSDTDRHKAGALSAALHRARIRLRNGADIGPALSEACAFLTAAGWDQVDYVSLVKSDTLEHWPDDQPLNLKEARLLGAGWVGTTRLIDNVALI
ncbi:MAG: pantoate--beta-alanine ligase [Pseudomonadota bacterium]